MKKCTGNNTQELGFDAVLNLKNRDGWEITDKIDFQFTFESDKINF